MTEKELTALKEHLRQLVVEDVGAAIRTIKEALPGGAPVKNTLLSLEGRLNDVNRQRLRGIISNDDLQRSYNQLRADLLDLISSLELTDFKVPAEGPAMPKGKTGSILYQIPGQMQLRQETKCIVRLAYEEASLIRNIELTEDTKLQSLRISQVMNVTLVDPNAEETFRIRKLSAEEQFVEQGDYTEWIFYVTPLAEGTFSLVLRVSVIELVLGKERKKDIVLEESIQISTQKTEAGTAEFKSAAYALSIAGGQPVSGAEIPGAEVYSPAPEAGTTSQPPRQPAGAGESTVSRSRRSYLGPLTAAASFLLLATVALTFLLPGLGKNEPSTVTESEEPELNGTQPEEPEGEELATPPHYDVRLLLPAAYRQADIRVDGRQVKPLEQQGEILLLRLERKSAPYRFELRSAGNTVCQQEVTIDSDGQLIELSCPSSE